jgi:hypothetical protein
MDCIEAHFCVILTSHLCMYAQLWSFDGEIPWNVNKKVGAEELFFFEDYCCL